jgi:hypothetical protein
MILTVSRCQRHHSAIGASYGNDLQLCCQLRCRLSRLSRRTADREELLLAQKSAQCVALAQQMLTARLRVKVRD